MARMLILITRLRMFLILRSKSHTGLDITIPTKYPQGGSRSSRTSHSEVRGKLVLGLGASLEASR